MKLLVHASVLMVFVALMLGTIFTVDGARRWLRRRKHGSYWNG